MGITLKIDGVELPPPSYDGIESGDNSFWSESSGRSNVTGNWIGDLKGSKYSYTFTYNAISASAFKKIKNAVKPNGRFKPSYDVEVNDPTGKVTFKAYGGDSLNLHYVSSGLGLYNVSFSMIER